MPRYARKKSTTGIYHIMLRAINRQDIFLDREDWLRFIDTLYRFKNKSGFKLYGYCLMQNHIHLLLHEGEEEIALVMKRIGVSYVHWYNKKNNRVGHLFQDRFKSETVEDDRYLLVVLRYIHQNPLKAGLVEAPDEYEWSSYNAYLHERKKLVNRDFILSLFHSDRGNAREQFRIFMQEANEDSCLDDEDKQNFCTDHDIFKILHELTGQSNPKILFTYEKKIRDDILLKLRRRGATIRQLSEISGLGRGVIERVTRS